MANLRRNWIRVAVAVLVVGGMGITLPSCPGQEAMQQQIQALQTSVTEATTKNRALENQLTTLRNELQQHKQLIDQLGQTQTAHKASIDGIETMVKELDVKVSNLNARPAPKAAAKKPAGKKR